MAQALYVIASAVDRYKELCEGLYSGGWVGAAWGGAVRGRCKELCEGFYSVGCCLGSWVVGGVDRYKELCEGLYSGGFSV